MRIDRLTITNFKRFASCEFKFDSQFNLIVGDNASGKTSALDALSIAVDGWFLGLRGAQTAGGIFPEHVHVDPQHFEDKVNFEKQFPARIEASGQVMGQDITWSRELSSEKGRTTTNKVKNLVNVAKEHGLKDHKGYIIQFPLTHEELSFLVGAHRVSITKAMKSLKESGKIVQQGRSLIIIPVGIADPTQGPQYSTGFD